MRVEGFRVRVAEAADVVGVVALERGLAEAPHWAEGEYAAMVDADKADSAVRRCFFVAEAEGRLLGFAVGKVIGSNGEGVGAGGSSGECGGDRSVFWGGVRCCRAACGVLPRAGGGCCADAAGFFWAERVCVSTSGYRAGLQPFTSLNIHFHGASPHAGMYRAVGARDFFVLTQTLKALRSLRNAKTVTFPADCKATMQRQQLWRD